MLSIISPAQFKQIPWKNGKGITSELAINKGGTLDNFDWRLSIASVVEDGEFSDFSGYWRNLVLISGDGIALTHSKTTTIDKEIRTDQLNELLQVSSFDGGCKTTGKLVAGAINDFNVMANVKSIKAKVSTYNTEQTITIGANDLCFVYALDTIHYLLKNNNQKHTLSAQHLLRIDSVADNEVTITGSMMIVIYLEKL